MMEPPAQDSSEARTEEAPTTDRDFFATVARGAEDVLAEELRELGVYEIEVVHGGVHFAGSLEDGYRVCVGTRVASRILLPLDRFEAQDAAALYEGVARTQWTDHLGPETTFAVDVAGKGTAGPGKFVALKTKDAIVDMIRDAEGSRPSIDKVDPGLRVHVHLSGTQVTVSIDLVGRGLHRRGVGRTGGAAPLKESLAAALLRMAGWHRREGADLVLLDPMCGSGTFLIEAAWMARDVAPGLRRGFGAPGWRAHDREAFARVIAAAEARKAAAADRTVVLVGVDSSEEQLGHARDNLKAAGVTDAELRHGTLADLEPPEGPSGLFVVNPPYGERLGEAGELGPLYSQLGDVLK
ncbi:MAG: 23S rRNA (guanine(2445)-N(2))/(guanine(2069)-N(7))-methyltransferase, partial [Deltaproteobacteria bacterium]|nr:23S rRNA (guanine(2445)-N(2))/(guanine(2069)-N(7))-methyltransferase [Deltaproteobacteria bacterium]